MTREERNRALTEAIGRCDSRAENLMLTALALSEMLEGINIKEEPRADGGRPLKFLNMVLEDAVEYITELQISAKYAADELLFIKQEVSSIIDHAD